MLSCCDLGEVNQRSRGQILRTNDRLFRAACSCVLGECGITANSLTALL